ncbi:hypothetical protein [Kocuria rosea]|nr:hypothetical protein [Kocuria rosea]WJZ68561.1 hypothetical protein QR564_18365 [Kocuria rosea]
MAHRDLQAGLAQIFRDQFREVDLVVDHQNTPGERIRHMSSLS